MLAKVSRISLVAISMMLAHCGDDASESRADASKDPDLGPRPSADAGPADARAGQAPDAAANDGAAKDGAAKVDAAMNAADAGTGQDGGRAADGGSTDGAGKPEPDASRAASAPDPSMVTKGPTTVSGSMRVGDSDPINFVSGFAYSYPLGESRKPALKFVFTNFPYSGCDPQALQYNDAKEDRFYAYCEADPPSDGSYYPLWVQKGGSIGTEFHSFAAVGCRIVLTQGSYEGGQQVIGKMEVTPVGGGATQSTVNFQMNHCGMIATVGNI
jgi:hypothetical protein